MIPPKQPNGVLIDREHYDAVIFDTDGVITRTAEILHSMAWKRMFDQFFRQRKRNGQYKLQLKGKPAPDIFIEAAKSLGATPSRTVVVEAARGPEPSCPSQHSLTTSPRCMVGWNRTVYSRISYLDSAVNTYSTRILEPAHPNS